MKTPSSEPSGSSAPLRIAVVGCGGITRGAHLPAILALPQVEVTCLCDSTLANANLAKAEFSLDCPVTDAVADLAGKVDAAVVAVPPRFHAPVTLQLLELGIGVLCEKPLASTVAEGRSMIAAADLYEQVLAVGFQQRFHLNNSLLRNVLADGLLGEPLEIVAEFGGMMDGFSGTPTYFSRATTAGGVLFDMGVHMVDRVLWLFGDLHNIEFEDDAYEGGFEANAVLRGSVVTAGREIPCRMAFSWTHGLNNSIRVRGSEATAEVKTGEPTALRLHRSIAGRNRVMTMADPAGGGAFNPYRLQLKDFAEAVQSKQDPLVTGRSALKSLEVIEQAYQVRHRLSQPWVEVKAKS